MKEYITWTIISTILLIGVPWFSATFAGSAGMAICLLLFFAVNPLYAAVCGAYAGKNIKQFWTLPVVTAGLFLAGAWLFFEMGEPAFLLYSGYYLVIGITVMLISSFVNKRKQ